MLTPIPALDIMDGRVVRLRQGDFTQKTTYDRSPLEWAQTFEAAGCKHLHLVDLDAAKTGKLRNLHVVQSLRDNTALTLQWGGGLRSEEAALQALSAGADRLVFGTLAVQAPRTVENIAERFGPERVVIGADVKNGAVAIHGWETTSSLALSELITRFRTRGVQRYLVTDVAVDGMMAGPAASLYATLLRVYPGIQLIASGGIRSIDDLNRLQQLGVNEAVIGRAVLEGVLDLNQWNPC